MRYSQTFPKTIKQVPAGADSINHQLLVRGGYMDQLMAGSWTLLPLGWRVVSKINDIIREELNVTGALEMLMPLLHPRDIWDQTGRWSDPDVKEIMYQFKDIRGKELGLSFTHEEIVMNLLGKYIHSYKDLPVKIYHFSTKFRNEPRAKSGILRGREFLMKDLYSAHVSKEDLQQYFQQVKEAYLRIFKKMELEARVVDASGGIFTDSFTQEFQVVSPVGEDNILICESCDFAANIEVSQVKEGEKCPRCKGEIKMVNSIEAGHIFTLGTKYAKNMGVFFLDEQNKKQDLWFGSYGIGVSRLVGVLVEIFHDDKGIIWPESVAPYIIHLVGLGLEEQGVKNKAEEVYQKLQDKGVEVLYDDRIGVSAGEKFADADLIGIPLRVVVSRKTHSASSGQAEDKLEIKRRGEEKVELVTLEELLKEIEK
ncbi:MAG: Prolyl-tRNA synthetase [Candidatus Daviesbacteria bacterium GW2011_GWA1_41_61]|nr:MAG: Prolyl-tRNA synthetase [Candidatus Daviesbacteria bacterium GW2011_GWB1_41_15]KKS14856.1 MAG: Prolyl-tRNA synthetase [Candidatus Daviesbacteria bacterium GW2011_GWA1_41_61]